MIELGAIIPGVVLAYFPIKKHLKVSKLRLFPVMILSLVCLCTLFRQTGTARFQSTDAIIAFQQLIRVGQTEFLGALPRHMCDIFHPDRGIVEHWGYFVTSSRLIFATSSAELTWVAESVSPQQSSTWATLSPLPETPLTASMISNYVKRGLLSSPVKKQYSRDQVAYLFFIAVAKNVLSLDALACFLRLQERTYPLEKA